MRFLQSSWCPLCIGIIFTAIILLSFFSRGASKTFFKSVYMPFREDQLWHPPDPDHIPSGADGDLVRYGKELIVNTSMYLGPRGIVSRSTNGMNCGNCHLDGGSRNFSNPFSAVVSTYPKFRDRSGKMETIEFRINECMQRSLNGDSLENGSPEMKALVAYMNWIGQNIPDKLVPKGFGTGDLPFLSRAADPVKGQAVYTNRCSRCHGNHGEGIMNRDSSTFIYPPLWGDNSYNVSAGLYRLRPLAGFIRSSMPFDKPYGSIVLSDEEAWDVAAYIASQPRPVKMFPEDWPDISRKPVDHPFGPYADAFPESQHKYGPYAPIVEARKKQAIKKATP